MLLPKARAGTVLALAVFVALGFSALAQASAFVIFDNEASGKISAENGVVKVVWHYKTLSSEYGNRGGGNIYELYYKPTDPFLNNSMVKPVNTGGGGTSPPMMGIGGLGSTYIYSDVGKPATGDNGAFSSLVNGSKNYSVDADGVARFEASFVVKNFTVYNSTLRGLNPNFENYQVDKRWKVRPNGVIELNVTMALLRDFNASEPFYGFAFNRNYGWDRAEILVHEMLWPCSSCEGVGSDGYKNPKNGLFVIDNLQTSGLGSNTHVAHVQRMTLAGGAAPSPVRLSINKGGGGFESGGMFKFGFDNWGTVANDMTGEFTNAYSAAGLLGEGFGLHWYGWWGGGAPQASRYKPVKAGTTWSDNFTIELGGNALDSSAVYDIPLKGFVVLNGFNYSLEDASPPASAVFKVSNSSGGTVCAAYSPDCSYGANFTSSANLVLESKTGIRAVLLQAYQTNGSFFAAINFSAKNGSALSCTQGACVSQKVQSKSCPELGLSENPRVVDEIFPGDASLECKLSEYDSELEQNGSGFSFEYQWYRDGQVLLVLGADGFPDLGPLRKSLDISGSPVSSGDSFYCAVRVKYGALSSKWYKSNVAKVLPKESVSVDAGKEIGKIGRGLFGQGFELSGRWTGSGVWSQIAWNGPQKKFDDQRIALLREMGVDELRFGGCSANTFMWDRCNNETHAPFYMRGCSGAWFQSCSDPRYDAAFDDNISRYMREVGAKQFVATVGLVGNGSAIDGRNSMPPSYSAGFVDYVNRHLGWNVTYWELGNELYSTWQWNMSTIPQLTPAAGAEYGILAKQHCDAMKRADARIKCGVPVMGYTPGAPAAGWLGLVNSWMQNALSQIGADADFLIYHAYDKSGVPNQRVELTNALEAPNNTIAFNYSLAKGGNFSFNFMSAGANATINLHVDGQSAASVAAGGFKRGMAQELYAAWQNTTTAKVPLSPGPHEFRITRVANGTAAKAFIANLSYFDGAKNVSIPLKLFGKNYREYQYHVPLSVAAALNATFRNTRGFAQSVLGRSPEFAVTEFACTWFNYAKYPSDEDLAGRWWTCDGLSNALRYQQFMREGVQHADIWYQSPRLFGTKTAPVVRPQYHLFQLLSKHTGSTLVQTSASNEPAFTGDDGTSSVQVPYLSITSSKSADGSKLFVQAVNLHLERGIPAQIALQGYSVSSSTIYTLKAENANDNNELSQKISPATVAGPSSSAFEYFFPKMSITVFEFSGSGGPNPSASPQPSAMPTSVPTFVPFPTATIAPTGTPAPSSTPAVPLAPTATPVGTPLAPTAASPNLQYSPEEIAVASVKIADIPTPTPSPSPKPGATVSANVSPRGGQTTPPENLLVLRASDVQYDTNAKAVLRVASLDEDATVEITVQKDGKQVFYDSFSGRKQYTATAFLNEPGKYLVYAKLSKNGVTVEEKTAEMQYAPQYPVMENLQAAVAIVLAALIALAIFVRTILQPPIPPIPPAPQRTNPPQIPLPREEGENPQDAPGDAIR